MEKRNGRLIILSSPSGGGKSTVCRMLRERIPDMEYSISTTTRAPRGGEEDGKEYFFVTDERFKKMIEKGDFIEWAVVHGNYYGTGKEHIEKFLKRGRDCILDIDVQGGMQIKEKYPDALLIFILPPSLEVLEKRLKGRKSDSEKNIKKRLETARKEMDHKGSYDHIVVNDRIGETVNKIVEILNNN